MTTTRSTGRVGHFLFFLLRRPALWTGLISIIAYWDEQALRGTFVYDDSGSVRNNVVVNGQVPLTDLWRRDFWGTLLSQPQSHKSFRPVTTLTFWWNWHILATKDEATAVPSTYAFHVVNVLLHGLVTLLVTETAAVLFASSGKQCSLIAQLVTGFTFGLHPVHAEAVSNITSRGELLMSVFFLAAFLSFAHQRQRQQKYPSVNTWQKFQSILLVDIIPWLCMTLSLFSKEQGATTLIALVIWDFLQQFENLVIYLQLLRQRDESALHFLRRTVILAAQTILICYIRYLLNGATSPDFITDQNPAGFAKDRFTRHFSVSWVYCLYLADMICPIRLSCDWSGRSIPLITQLNDWRVGPVLLLWIVCGWAFVSLIVGPIGSKRHEVYQRRRILLQSFFCFTVTPFLLSSNLIVVVGLMKADRVIYLPLLGYCLLQASLASLFCHHSNNNNKSGLGSVSSQVMNVVTNVVTNTPDGESSTSSEPPVPAKPLLTNNSKQGTDEANKNENGTIGAASTAQHEQPNQRNNEKNETINPISAHDSNSVSALLRKRVFPLLAYLLFLLQLFFYCAKLHERNIAWSDSLRLWGSAYQINPTSHHTIYNCGYELSLRKRYHEAELVLRPIADPHTEGPSNTFVYAMVLYNLNRCDIALDYIDRAFSVVEQNKKDPSVRNTPKSLARVESNLLVAQAFCYTTTDLPKAGKLMYKAVDVDPTNDYAIQQATNLVQTVQGLQLKQQQLKQQQRVQSV